MRITKADDTLEEFLYSCIRQVPQDAHPLIPWSDKLKPFISQLREWDTQGLIESRGVLGQANEFSNGLRLMPRFILQLAKEHEDEAKLDKLTDVIENSSDWLDGFELADRLGLPLATIYSFFWDYDCRGQGNLSKETRSCSYR